MRLRESSRLLLLVLTVLVVGAGIWWLRRPQTLLQAARSVQAAVERRDAERIWVYVSQRERDDLRLDQGSFEAFLRDFIFPAIQGFEPTGEPVIEAYRDLGGLDLTQRYRHHDGRESSITVRVFMTDDGPKAIPLVAHLFFAAAWANWRPGPPFPSGQAKLQYMAEFASTSLEKLRSTGVAGFSTVGNPTHEVKYTWEEWIRHNENLLKRLAAK
jgi:hypothetical protein